MKTVKEAEQMLDLLQKQVGQQPINKKPEELGRQMFTWTLAQLVDATHGDLIGPLCEAEKLLFESVSTDTRTIKPGALYIAIKGERFDGHEFISEAVKQGAVAVLVSQEVDTIVPAVQVADTRLALGDFARWHRQQMPLKKLIAVTGSNGKTSVKTMLNDIFSAVAPTLATEGNLNNDFGVPRTLLNLRPEHEYAIIEMGANHCHEIDYLTALALPDIAIINNAAGAHLEGFGSIQGVIQGKGEIYQGLNRIENREPGVAIINTDSPGFDEWMQITQQLGVEHRMTFGTHRDAKVRLHDVQALEDDIQGINFALSFSEMEGSSIHAHELNMPVLGFHNAMNAAACTAVALSAGLQWQQIKTPLERFGGVPGRLQKNRISCGWLVDDSYNANPESVKAGINALTSLPGKSVLCLGAMAEIGETSAQAHDEISEYAKSKGIDYLFVYGLAAKNMPQVFGIQGHYCEDHAQMVAAVSELVEEFTAHGDAFLNVLVKGSRSAAMEKVAQPLVQKYKK